MDDAALRRANHFTSNCLAWAALVHFLPANLLRELCCVIVDQVSASKLTLEELFEERLLQSSDDLDQWGVRPRRSSDPVAQYLQRRVRTLVWGSDDPITFDESHAFIGPIDPLSLENAILLGIADFSSPGELFQRMTFPDDHESVQIFRETVSKMRDHINFQESTSRLSALDAILCSVEMPLSAVMIKHLGDLCADGDRWSEALSFYREANNLLVEFDRSEWRTYRGTLIATTTQSISAALRSTEGPRAAADYLVPKIEAALLDSEPLFLANASHDAFVAAALASDTLFVPDHRAEFLLPPLILSSHNLTAALQASIGERFAEVPRYFWQVLRRQIALGSASESRVTKAFYAKALFEGLDQSGAGHRKPDAFLLGVRLLIESGQSTLAEKISWGDELVRSYVDHDLVFAAIAHAQKHDPAPRERLNVLLEILEGWAKVTAIERSEVAGAIIGFLAATAKENRSSFYRPLDAGGRSMKSIRQLAELRPEFRVSTAAQVTAAIVAKLQGSDWWPAIEEALKTAGLYAEVLSDGDLTEVVTATLTMLEPIDPAKDVWVIVRPALGFLSSQTVKSWSTRHPELAKRVVSAILNFCINQQTEHTRLLFFLQDFDRTLLSEQVLSSQLAEVVADIRNMANTTNASNSIDNIRALLICPAVSGSEGVKDALQALGTVLRSALTGRPSPSFFLSYDALLLLAERFSQIAETLSLDPERLGAWLEPLLADVKEVWIKARQDPMIFAPFSVPPQTRPNAVAVHNWAYASISFARVLGRQDEILQTLSGAAEQIQLADAIAKARAGRMAVGDIEEIDAASIRTENRETFYSVLGQRLIRIRQMAHSEPIVDALLDQCMRYGPNGLDAAVFLLAADLKLDPKKNPHYINYERRLVTARDLRLALTPLLYALGDPSKHG
jgi:hypothetical protein